MAVTFSITRATTRFHDSNGNGVKDSGELDFDLVDVGVYDPGETLYTRISITNSNASTEPATGVTVADNFSGSTMVNASGVAATFMNISPIAFSDTFQAIGNTVLRVGTANSINSGESSFFAGNLTSNDVGGLTGDSIPGFTIVAVTGGVSANGGTFNIFSDGTFNYVNDGTDANLTSDTFTYTIRDLGFDGVISADDLTSMATVTITFAEQSAGVPHRVWYVDSSAAPGGDGTSAKPFQNMTALNGLTGDGTTNDDLDKAGEYIYVENGAGAPVTGPITLENNQQLIGDGAALVVAGVTLATAGANSTLTAASGTIVTLASGNTIAGLNVGDGTGTANGIAGTGIGTLTVNNVAIDAVGSALALTTGAFAGSGFTTVNSDGGTNNVSFTNVTGTVALGGGALTGASGASLNMASTGAANGLNVTYSGSITQGNNAALVNVDGGTNGHTGTLTLTGTVSATNGTGLQFNNADGTYNFNGTNTLNGGDAGIDIIGGSNGTFSFSANSSITNPTGIAFRVDGGTGNITFNGTITDDVGQLVAISNRTGGTIDFNGAITDGDDGDGSGILLDNNDGSTIRFDGGLTLSTGANTAFTAINGGTVVVTDPDGAGAAFNKITTTTGTALNVQNTFIGLDGLTFQSITSTTASGNNAINLTSTGTTAGTHGGLTVTGTDGGDAGTLADTGTGGTISNKSADSIVLNGTRAVSLNGMTVTNNSGGSWIDADNVVGLTLNNFNANNSFDHGIDGSGVTNLVINGGKYEGGGTLNGVANFDGIHLTNLLGTSSITGATFERANTRQIYIVNNQATAVNGTADQLTVSGNTFQNHAVSPFHGDHLSVSADTGSNMKLVVDSSVAANTFKTAGIAVQASGAGSGKMEANISGITSGGTVASGNINTAGVVVIGTATSTVKFNVSNNIILGSGSVGMSFNDFTSGNYSGTISGNNVTHIAGAGTDAVQIVSHGDGNGAASDGIATIAVLNNTIIGNFQRGLRVQSAFGDGTLNINITGNTVHGTDPTPPGSGGLALRAIEVEVGGSGGGTTDKIFLNLQGNNAWMDNGNAGYRLLHRSGYTFSLEDYTGVSTDAAGVTNWIDNVKSNNGNGAAAATTLITGAANGFATHPNTPAPLMAVAAPPEAVVEVVATPAPDNSGADNGTPAPASGETPPPPAPVGPVLIEDGVLSQSELDFMVDAAIQRWAAAGASDEQIAAMRAVLVSVSDLGGLTLGESGLGTITLDSDAAGWRWFLDSTPGDDSEYSGSGSNLAAVDALGMAGTRIDLLTVLTHELGHQIGLSDISAPGSSDELMYGTIGAGQRRLPGSDDLAGAVAGPVTGAFAFAPVSLGTIPVGQTVVVEFRHVIDSPGEDRLVGAWSGQTTLDSAETAPQFSNVESGNVDGLTLGDLIFNDVNKSGLYDAGDSVLAGVTLRIYGDTNNNNVFDAGDLYVGYNELGGGAGYQQGIDTPAAPGSGTPLTATSNASGIYSFSKLAPGDYIVQIDASNFSAGGALAGMRGVFGGADPDGAPDVDNDDNGLAGPAGSVVSNAVTLSYDNEPTAGVGNDTNNRLDFGFVVNSAPVANPDSVGATEDTQAQYSTQLTANDSDADLDTLTITAVSNFVNGSGSVTNGVVTFNPTANFNGTASFTYTISDGNGHTASNTATVTVGAVNDPVTIGAPASATLNEDVVDFAVTGISIADVDSALAPAGVYEVVLQATHGTLKMTTVTGLTFTAGDGDGDSTMTFHGTLADLNAALATVKYTPAGHYNGAAQIDIDVTDQFGATVATGSGAATADFHSIDLTVNSVNDAPVGAHQNSAATEGVEYAFSATDFSENFSDPVEGNSFAGIRIESLPATGTLKLNGVAVTVPADVTLLQLTNGNLTYLPAAGSAGSSPTFQFRVRDNGGTANGGQDYAASENVYTINIASANAAPVLDLDADGSGTGFASAYTEGGAAAAISDTDVLITDADPGDMVEGATITITNAVAGDVLTVVGALPGSITLSGTSTATNVVLTGTGTQAEYEAAIEQITFSNTGDDPTNKGANLSRSISVVVNDGAGNSNTATATIAVTGVNDKPTINNLQGDNVGFTGGSSAPQYADAGGNASVVDDSPNFDQGTLTVEITANEAAAEDVLAPGENADYKIDANLIVYQNSIIIANFSGGANGEPLVFLFRAAATASHVSAVTALVNYVNTNQADPSDAQRTLTWTLTDGDGGTSDAVTSTISVTGVNQAPVLTTGGPIAATEQTAVAILPAGSVADADLDARGTAGDYAGSTFSVNRNPATNATQDVFTLVAGPNFTIDGSNLKSGGSIFGTISVNGSAGLIVINFPSQQTAATSALVDEVIQAVRYTNSSDNPPASVDLAVGFDDGASGGGQGTVISGNNLDVNVVTVNIAAVNDAPVNSLGATVSTGEDVVGASLGGMSISDPDADPATDEILVTFQVGNGTLNLRTDITNGIVAADIVNLSPGSITVRATLNKINATLADTNGLTYSPNANFNGNDTLTVTSNDRGANGSDPGLTGNGTSEQDVDTRAITVEASDDLAVAQDDEFSTPENAVATGSLFDNNNFGPDSDAENDPFFVTKITVDGQDYAPGTEIDLPSGAKLTVNSNGTYSYNPNGKFNTLTDNSSGAVNTSATETFSYTVTGGDTAIVTVTVDGVAGPGDWLMGDSGDNTITGTPQADLFRLQQGGNDTVYGLAGTDSFFFGAALTGADKVDGGADRDQITIQGDYSSLLTLGAEVVNVEYLLLLSGTDTRFDDSGNHTYSYNLASRDENVAAGEILVVDAGQLGAGENFTFNGSAELDGAFRLYGGLGTDNLTGGSLSDQFLFNPGRWGAADTVNGGGSRDQLALRGDYTITFGANQITSIESLLVLSGRDVKENTDYDYNLTMNDGNLASGVQMTVDAGQLRETEHLTFNGAAESNGSFRVFGGAGSDVITGSQNADIIVGRGSNDTLYGGGGDDVFRYDSTADSPATGDRDSIQDFSLGDVIDLSRIDADVLLAGDQAFEFIGTDLFGGVAGELRFQNHAGNIWLVQGDTDGDKMSDFEIFVVIVDSDPITAGDFIL